MPVLLHRIAAMNSVKHLLNKNKYKKVINLFYEINKNTSDGRITKEQFRKILQGDLGFVLD